MPLYMDIHTVDSDSFSVEDVVKAHMEDLSVQDRFGVRQIKYWVNVKEKTLFCLMEGPSKESCHEVHAQSHGQTACNIIEVNDDEFQLFLGQGKQDKTDLAQTVSGEIDTGYRSILTVQLLDLSGNDDEIVNELMACVESSKGSVIPLPNDLMATFVFASDAFTCALHIREILRRYEKTCEYRMALLTGRPVDEIGKDLFETTKRRLNCLCRMGTTNGMFTDRVSLQLAKKVPAKGREISRQVHILNDEAVRFLEALFEVIQKEWSNADFKSDSLHTALALSKSKLYRELKVLTGYSPNQLLQEMKLRGAASDLLKGELPVSQVAYDNGFNSPTYFTRTFKLRFGMLPTELSHVH